MKLLFSLVFTAISVFASATTYYIDPTGNNNNDGSSEHPWLTLSFAGSRVTKTGDIIHVNAGTYNETDRCNLAIGVSVEGVGDSSLINSTYVSSSPDFGSISLYSSNAGIQGNQSISFIKLSGNNLEGLYGIVVARRSNVKIHHCTITDFKYGGVHFTSGPIAIYSIFQIPASLETGNEIYSCTIENCSTNNSGSWNRGCLALLAQTGTLVHDNIFIQTSRIVGENGTCIYSNYIEGLKYYNNKTYHPDTQNSEWNITWEAWNTIGGVEVFSNEFHGGGQQIDCGGWKTIKGKFDYSLWVHDNLFALDAQIASGGRLTMAIDFESNCEDAIFNSNHIVNYPVGVMLTIDDKWMPSHARRIYVHKNIFENCGYSDSQFSYILYVGGPAEKATYEEIYFYNNILHSNGINKAWGGLIFAGNGTYSNIYLINNILVNFFVAPILVERGLVETFYSKNNILFNNGNSNDLKTYSGYGAAVTSYVNTDNLKADPLFLSSSDFTLQFGSPAIDAGINVGLPYQGNAPDIGVFESSDGELHLNQLPVISISSPTKGVSFISPATVTIDVEAFDPDGTITKVELFNDVIKLGESTSFPYSFTLKELPEGTYSLKAVATDNLKSTTTSSALEFNVTSYNENREYFNLFPNPNDGRFSINFTSPLVAESYIVTIYNLIGRTVYRAQLSKDEDIRQFDLSHLNPGTYVLVITSNEILFTQKFIKG